MLFIKCNITFRYSYGRLIAPTRFVPEWLTTPTLGFYIRVDWDRHLFNRNASQSQLNEKMDLIHFGSYRHTYLLYFFFKKNVYNH